MIGFEFEFGFEFELEFEAGAGLAAGRSFAAKGLALGLLVLGAGLGTPLGLGGQSPTPGAGVQAALGVDTATVGDVVPVVVRVPVAEGERVGWPDTLPVAGSSLENAARVRAWPDTLADGGLAATAAYAVTPWRTGTVALPAVRLEVAGGPEGPREVEVALPSLAVASVLPPDTAGLEPRPARDVLGPSWAWGRIIALALLALAAMAGLLWWWRRRRRSGEPAAALAPAVPPRARALAALREARDSGLLERGEVKEFYTRVSAAVRDYVAALEPGWGEDLTTTELLGRFRAQVGPSEAAALRGVLAPTDQVKFARREPDRDTALAEWAAARSWVVDFHWPPPGAVTEEAA